MKELIDDSHCLNFYQIYVLYLGSVIIKDYSYRTILS